MKKSYFILTVLSTLILVSCMDRLDRREIKVYNMSKTTVFSIISSDDYMNSSISYSDFRANSRRVNEINQTDFSSVVFSEIMPDSILESSGRPRSWDGLFKESMDGKIRVFIISSDSVKKQGWSKVFKDNRYTKKYELTMEDLDNSDWQIEYNGK